MWNSKDISPELESRISDGYKNRSKSNKSRQELSSSLQRPKVRENANLARSEQISDLFPLWKNAFLGLGIPAPIREHVFAPPRKWRFDLCWLKEKVALEIEGGVWTQGRHTRGKGFIKDIEKYNMATAMGWKVLRCTPDQLPGKKLTLDPKLVNCLTLVFEL